MSDNNWNLTSFGIQNPVELNTQVKLLKSSIRRGIKKHPSSFKAKTFSILKYIGNPILGFEIDIYIIFISMHENYWHIYIYIQRMHEY